MPNCLPIVYLALLAIVFKVAQYNIMPNYPGYYDGALREPVYVGKILYDLKTCPYHVSYWNHP